MTPGKELLFVALGGSGEIGMNVNLYGCDGQWLMVDLGISFGTPEYPGIDIVLPDIQFIEDNKHLLAGIVLTHGHEDHIGALPYLAADLGVPLYANRFTAGLIATKLAEEGLTKKVKVHVQDLDADFTVGNFGIRFVPLAHSIPDMCAALIRTPYGNVFHSGDWKLDEDPQMGEPSSEGELREIGDEGVLALVCDSTNVFNEDVSGSEGDVRANLLKVIEEAPNRVLVTTFASNAARLRTLGWVAKQTGRQLCVAGRSLDRIIGIAQENNYLGEFPDTVDFATAMKLPRNKVMIVATGGQGESRAALARIAEGNHQLALAEDDWVVFSSKQIPGNEMAIGRIQNRLAERGIVMVTERQAHIHVSGHPGRPELAAMYEWIRPEILVPVHGEIRHMKEHERFGLSQGIPKAVFQKNGDVIRLAPGKPKKIDEVTTGRLVLDGDVILAADGPVMNERRKLSLSGHISVAVARDSDGALAGQPEFRMLGVPVEDERDQFVADLGDAVAKVFSQRHKAKRKGDDAFREALRLAVRRVATDWTGNKPIVDVLLVEV